MLAFLFLLLFAVLEDLVDGVAGLGIGVDRFAGLVELLLLAWRILLLALVFRSVLLRRWLIAYFRLLSRILRVIFLGLLIFVGLPVRRPALVVVVLRPLPCVLPVTVGLLRRRLPALGLDDGDPLLGGGGAAGRRLLVILGFGPVADAVARFQPHRGRLRGVALEPCPGRLEEVTFEESTLM